MRMMLMIPALLIGSTAWGRMMAENPAALAAMRGQERPLLLFAPPGDDRAARQQAIATSHTKAFAERDIRLITIAGDTVAGAGDDASTLRRRYRVARDAFAMILIGKDGGEKLRSADPIPAERLFATIDAMPMRRDEMRR